MHKMRDKTKGVAGVELLQRSEGGRKLAAPGQQREWSAEIKQRNNQIKSKKEEHKPATLSKGDE